MESDRENEENDRAMLTAECIQQRLSVLGKNPFTHTFIYTTATLSNLNLTDLHAIGEFPQTQHVICSKNALQTLGPLRDLNMLLSVDASHNQLNQVLDFDTPKCTPQNAWVGGKEWIGSLVRRADLSYNRISVIRELSTSHPFLQELYLSNNNIKTLDGLAGLQYLRVLDLSYNRLTSTHGLLSAPSNNNESLRALQRLNLSHNSIKSVEELPQLPRLVEVDLSHNKIKLLHSLEKCTRLQRLDLGHNDIDSMSELNHLIPLEALQTLVLFGCPVVSLNDSSVFYRARVLRRLQQLVMLDGHVVSAKEKIKTLVMHGSDIASRQNVLKTFLPSEQFINYLPPLDFEEDVDLDRYYEQPDETHCE